MFDSLFHITLKLYSLKSCYWRENAKILVYESDVIMCIIS